MKAWGALALLAAVSAAPVGVVRAQDPAQIEQGRRLFTQAAPACAVCHTLKDAGAEGALRPSLDELRPDAHRAMTAMRNGIGQMPSYRTLLTEAQIQAVGAYVAQAAGR